MTAQVRENISVDGEQRSLCALPLAPLFRSLAAGTAVHGREQRELTPMRNDDLTEPGAVLPIVAHSLDGTGNDEAAERSKRAVAHLEGLPKKNHIGRFVADAEAIYS